MDGVDDRYVADGYRKCVGWLAIEGARVPVCGSSICPQPDTVAGSEVRGDATHERPGEGQGCQSEHTAAEASRFTADE